MHVLGELLFTEQELGNPEDRYAVSVLKLWTIVGHIVITKRHLKIIPSTFPGAIFRKKNTINGQTALILQWRLNYIKYGIIFV